MAPTEVRRSLFLSIDFSLSRNNRMVMNVVDKVDHQVVVTIIFFSINRKMNKQR